MPAYHLLIFDLDGTICDPITGIRGSINYALETLGHAPVSEDVVARFIGPPLNVAFETILPSATSLLIDELIALYRERYEDADYRQCTLYPGVEEALRFLDSCRVPMGLCTAKRSDLARRVLEHLNLADLFQFVDGGAIRQTKTDQLRRLCGEGRVPACSIMIGDRNVDLVAGRTCGLSVGGVLWGYGSLSELERESPEYLFSHPSAWKELAD